MKAPRPTPQLSSAGAALANRLIRAIGDYEAQLGRTPVWCRELPVDGALALLLSATRIGMSLPARETLQKDMRERDQSHPSRLGRPEKD